MPKFKKIFIIPWPGGQDFFIFHNFVTLYKRYLKQKEFLMAKIQNDIEIKFYLKFHISVWRHFVINCKNKPQHRTFNKSTTVTIYIFWIMDTQVSHCYFSFSDVSFPDYLWSSVHLFTFPSIYVLPCFKIFYFSTLISDKACKIPNRFRTQKFHTVTNFAMSCNRKNISIFT